MGLTCGHRVKALRHAGRSFRSDRATIVDVSSCFVIDLERSTVSAFTGCADDGPLTNARDEIKWTKCRGEVNEGTFLECKMLTCALTSRY